ncbi:3-hydroxyacyl-CoA dehydrogenase NAD-binding domain-containing protein [Azospirillum canadense]
MVNIETVGIVGAGVMGAGIAQVMAQSGLSVLVAGCPSRGHPRGP